MNFKRLLFISLLFFSCEESVKNKSTSNKDLKYYNLKYETIYDDNSTKIEIAIPNNFNKMKLNNPDSDILGQFEYLDNSVSSGKGLYSINIQKLESKNTILFDNEIEYLKIVKKGIDDKFNGNLDEASRIFSPVLKNLKIADFEYDLKINGKYFHKQIRYYLDKRLEGTEFENSNVTSFHYYTLHNKRKYSFDINYYGDDKGLSSLIGMFNSIAESIKFD